MTIYESLKKINDQEIEIYYSKLLNIRKSMKLIIRKLAMNSLLFCKNVNGLDNDILHSDFLTYDKQQKQVWSLHLMAGVLFNYWMQKKTF